MKTSCFFNTIKTYLIQIILIPFCSCVLQSFTYLMAVLEPLESQINACLFSVLSGEVFTDFRLPASHMELSKLLLLIGASSSY